MLNIVDLEKRWMRYKIKSYTPHFSILISLVIIMSIFLSFTSNSQELPQITKQTVLLPTVVKASKIKVKEAPILVSKVPLIKTKVMSAETKLVSVPTSTGVKLSPSLGFIKNMQSSLQPYYKDNTPYRQEPVYQVQSPKVEIVEEKKVIVADYTPAIKVKKINIKRQNTQNDIYEIITRFKKNNNPALSLFVAKKYYELQDYQQAYNYALITNRINSEIESSWIIFSKSLVKLGKRDKAIQTLKQYIKQSHSSTARILLDEIYAGKFK